MRDDLGWAELPETGDLAGTMDSDLTAEPLGRGSDGQPVYLRDIWPSQAEIDDVIASCLRPDT